MPRRLSSYQVMAYVVLPVLMWGGAYAPPCFAQEKPYVCPATLDGAPMRMTEIWSEGIVNGPPDTEETSKKTTVQKWVLSGNQAYDVTLICAYENGKSIKMLVPGPLHQCIKLFHNDRKHLSPAYHFSCE